MGLNAAQATEIRDIFLLVYRGALFNAHWAIWVPSATHNHVGTSIHVTGSLREGFVHEFKRNYNPKETGRSVEVLPLGHVRTDAIADFPYFEDITFDITPIDQLEREALSVPAPGPSMRSSTATGPIRRIVVEDCQVWLKHYATHLVQLQLLSPEALEVLEQAPQK
ncbi:hypothetical protein QCA50_013670 [Cerrena zonata]|uniref:Uncharacterized protein n=1 Tax=Cerrena zonata TaxID=2478898 RepID=A0AAW0FTH5_9APHY